MYVMLHITKGHLSNKDRIFSAEGVNLLEADSHTCTGDKVPIPPPLPSWHTRWRDSWQFPHTPDEDAPEGIPDCPRTSSACQTS